MSKDENPQQIFNYNFRKGKTWFLPNQLVINETKTMSLIFYTKKSNQTHEGVEFLGVHIANLNWNEQIDKL